MKRNKKGVVSAFGAGFLGALMYDVFKEVPEFKAQIDEFKKVVKVCQEKNNQDSAKTAGKHSNRSTCKDVFTVESASENRGKSGRSLGK